MGVRDPSPLTVSTADTLPFAVCSVRTLSNTPSIRKKHFSALQEAAEIAHSFSIVLPGNDGGADLDQSTLFFSGKCCPITDGEDARIDGDDRNAMMGKSRLATRSLTGAKGLSSEAGVQLWWGAELIQRGDMCLLALRYGDAFGDAADFSAARNERAFFLQVDAIFVKNVLVGVRPADPPVKNIQVIGMLCELVAEPTRSVHFETDDDAMDVDEEEGSGREPNHLPPPPPGYRFNKLARFYVCPTLISGRYYPAIWAHPLLAPLSWLSLGDALNHLKGLSVKKPELLSEPPTWYASRKDMLIAVASERNALAVDRARSEPEDGTSPPVPECSSSDAAAIHLTEVSGASHSALPEEQGAFDDSPGSAVFERVRAAMQGTSKINRSARLLRSFVPL